MLGDLCCKQEVMGVVIVYIMYSLIRRMPKHVGILLLALLAGGLVMISKRADIPDHLVGHAVENIKDLIPPKVAIKLWERIRTMGKDGQGFDDVSKAVGKVPLAEHIGEAVPLNTDGKCDHHLMVPNYKREQCVIPGRVDVGKHFILTGGAKAIREDFESMVSRVSAFMRYMWNLEDFPEVRAVLFPQQQHILSLFAPSESPLCPAVSR